MGLVQQLYDLSADEAMKLTDSEANFLLESAQLHMFQMATTSPAMKEILKQRLEPTIKQVREARKEGGSSTPQKGGTGGGVGEPPQ